MATKLAKLMDMTAPPAQFHLFWATSPSEMLHDLALVKVGVCSHGVHHALHCSHPNGMQQACGKHKQRRQATVPSRCIPAGVIHREPYRE